MKVSDLSRYTLGACAAAAMLAGCGGSQQTGSGAGPLPQAATTPTRGNAAHAGASALNKDDSAVKREKLVYISSTICGHGFFSSCYPAVSVYKYSDGAYLGEWSGTTKGEAYGECSDRAGHVFVGATSATIDAKSAVLEFAHGGTNPIKVLSDPSGYAAECSVDPVSGNLAVINGGAVLIYAGASGYPTKYTDPNMSFNFVGYDGNGNLFVDGSGSTSLAELPKGGNSFKPIKLNQAIGYPGSVQWDGKYMTVEDYDTSVIYRFAITGRRGRKIGSTPLLVNGYGGLLQPPTWIFGKRVIAIFQVVCTSFCSDVAPIYDYPAGGNPAKLLGSGSNSVEVTSVDGITVSPPD